MTSPTKCQLAASLLALPVAAASADWPTSPGSPLHIGAAQGPDTDRHAITLALDDAIWISWQDPYCQGDLRLNRVSLTGQLLADGGIVAQPDPTCGAVQSPQLVASGSGVVLSRAFAALATEPVQRFDADGTQAWSFTVPTEEFYDHQYMARLFAFANGDTLVVTKSYFDLHLDRLAADGTSVWDQPLVFDPGTPSANVVSVVSDGDDGVYLFWDWHTTYRKTARVTRITADGALAFPPVSPLRVGELEGHSRHTPPVAIADGQGGAIFIWTKGFETAWTPAPLFMQRIGPDGSLAFPIDGHRIALSPERQFDPQVLRDEATNDLLITWRDGLPNADPTLHAQRISPAGDRLWGEEGVEVAPIDPLLGRFAPVWWNDTLAIPATGPDGAVIHRVTAAGLVEPGPWPISPPTPARSIRAAEVDDGLVVVWHTAEGFENDLFAQRVNDGGRLGNPACSLADFAAPFGSLDFFDIAEFLAAFSSGDEAADIVHDGAFNIFDITVYLGAFSEGCP